MHHAPPTWTCLHYQYPTPWNLPFTILHRTYEQHLFVPSVVPVPVGGNHHSVLLFFLSDKDRKCVHFFLNTVEECEFPQMGDTLLWNGMKQNRLNVLSKPARVCYLEARIYDNKLVTSRKFANWIAAKMTPAPHICNKQTVPSKFVINIQRHDSARG